MPLKKDILSFIKTKDYEGLEYELKNLKTNQKFLNESLKWACFEGDARSVEILIKFGANANYTDEFGTTGLHFGIKGGRQDVVIALLNNGANYCEWEMDGINLVQWSIRHGFDEVLDVLVKKFGVNLTELDATGRTSLHTACMYGQVKIVEYILETGLLSVDERDENGWTPLHYACSEAGSNFRKMIRVLFKHGADPILLTTNNKTSLDLAYESGRAQQLIDVLTVHKMLQLLISVDNVIVGGKTISNIDASGNQSSGSDGENVERQLTVKQKPYQPLSKAPDRHLVLKLSIWRKVLLNDDVEILQEYRDSGIWYNPEKPIGFEQCQELTKENFSEIFNDSYENGVGLFSYFNDNFKKEIHRQDFYNILVNICGLTKFPCLAADECVLFGSFHESILFLGLITGRFKVVEMLLKMRQFDIIPFCLMICLITRHMQLIKNFPPQIIDNLRALSFKSEIIAVDVLNRVYFKDNSPEKQVTLQLINSSLSSYGGMSLIDLADLANCSNFLSLPCCQLILDRRWYGNLRPLRSHIKWVIRFIPVTILFYNPYKKSLAETTKIEKSMSATYRLGEVKIVPKDKRKGHKKVSELEEFEHQESYLSSSSRLQVLHAVVNAPGTKFFYHSTAHFIFLLIMSYTMLFDYNKRFKAEEVLCYMFVLGYGIEEVRQCVLVSLRSSIMDYLRDKWNWLDLSAISTTVLGVILKVVEQNTLLEHKDSYDEIMSPLLYYSRVALLLGLLLFYLRILFIVSISAILGPKLRMIGDMLRKDFLPLLLLFFIFILAFGVLFQGLLYPNGWLYSTKKSVTPMMVMNSTVEIVGMLLKRAIYGIFEADFPIDETKCSDKDYCVHPVGQTIFLSFSLIVYIVIVYIMLMNLLIALFSNTVARIDQRSTEHWLAGRYKLVEEYKERSIFPPPFNLLERTVNLLVLILRGIRCSRCKDSISLTYKVVNQPETEVNIVVKFIIIQAFALKTCRYLLGTKDSRDVLSASSSVEKKSELEIRSIKERMFKMDAKIDRVLSLLGTGRQSNNSRQPDDTIIRTFSHFKYQPRNESKRNSRISNTSSYKVKERDGSLLEENNPDWNLAVDSFANIIDEDAN